MHHREAAFRPDDRLDVIDRDFICPRCGSCPGVLRLFSVGAGWTAETLALCHCVSCSARWTVGLDLAQTMRITHIGCWRGPHPREIPNDPFDDDATF